MKNRIRKLLCAAPALMLLFRAAEDPQLPADEQDADESLLTILGLAAFDDTPAGRSACAEEVPPETVSGNAAATEAGGDSDPAPAQPESTGDAQTGDPAQPDSDANGSAQSRPSSPRQRRSASSTSRTR